MTRDFTIISA